MSLKWRGAEFSATTTKTKIQLRWHRRYSIGMGCPVNPYWRGRISIVELLVPVSSDQPLKNVYFLFYLLIEEVNCTEPSLQLGFPGLALFDPLIVEKQFLDHTDYRWCHWKGTAICNATDVIFQQNFLL